MTNSNSRKKDIAAFALPPDGTKEYAKKLEILKRYADANPQNDKIIFEKQKTAFNTILTQLKNGAGLPLDKEIRYFLQLFNDRNMQHGLRSMPSSFNILEGFFNYNPEFSCFLLLQEENCMVSLFDYIDFITSPNFKENKQDIINYLEDDIIYHYDILNKLEEITFTTENGEEYVIAGVSLLKRGNEVLVFLLTGLITDTKEETKKIDFDFKPVPGKENIKLPTDRIARAEPLLGNEKYWKTLAYCRIDLEKSTIDNRYIQKDLGVAFTTITDDITNFLDSFGELKPEYKDAYEISQKEIIKYSPLFELATKCLYLPFYLDNFDDEIKLEEHSTEIKEFKRTKTVFKKDVEKLISNEYKITTRPVWCLERNSSIKADVIYFGENEFKIDRSGYWKTIDVGAVGKDKSGNVIHGKTWVEKMLSWYESDNQTLSANFKQNIVNRDLIKDNQGYIYLMRNASHEIDIFKIGLTTIDTKTRAKSLSSTTSSPDKFLIAHEWFVQDCNLAEKMIHSKLEQFRINSRREFFKIDFANAINSINHIVEAISIK